MDMVRALFNVAITIFIIAIINPVHSQQQRKVYSASVGENKTLPCLDTISSGVSALYWMKNGSTVLSYRSDSVNDAPPAENKYRRDGNTGRGLVIINLNHFDAGNYSCSVALKNSQSIGAEMELIVTELLVSPCNQDSQNVVDGCSCSINGGETSDLSCRTLGFPREPDITWKLPGKLRLESSTVNLTSYSDNMTLVCRAQDAAVLEVTQESDPVCVFYPLQMEATDKPPVKGAASTNKPEELDTASPNLWMISAICIVIIIIIIIIICLKRRGYLKESSCILNCLKNDSQGTKHRSAGGEIQASYNRGSVIRDSGVGCSTVQVLNSSRIAGCGVHISALGDSTISMEPMNSLSPINTSSKYNKVLRSMSVEDKGRTDGNDNDCGNDSDIDKEFNDLIVPEPEAYLPLFGKILLEDLREASQEMKKSIKAAAVKIVNKRLKPYKRRDQVLASSSGAPQNVSLPLGMSIDLEKDNGKSSDTEFSFVNWVCDRLDRIGDERDRDECELMLTTPSFQTLTDPEEIPCRKEPPEVDVHENPTQPMLMTSTMNVKEHQSVTSLLRGELMKMDQTTKTKIRDDIPRMILSMLESSRDEASIYQSQMGLPSCYVAGLGHAEAQIARLVALWTSKMGKLDDDIQDQVMDYLYTMDK